MLTLQNRQALPIMEAEIMASETIALKMAESYAATAWLVAETKAVEATLKLRAAEQQVQSAKEAAEAARTVWEKAYAAARVAESEELDLTAKAMGFTVGV
jgi:ribulose 1,5-bisphosphate carboxylase large subunit-like protein